MSMTHLPGKGGNINIKIEYDGKYPSLCSGSLVVKIDGKRWAFPAYCLISHRDTWLDNYGEEHISRGKWSIEKWPAGFPENLKVIVEQEVNEELPYGCCGGCL